MAIKVRNIPFETIDVSELKTYPKIQEKRAVQKVEETEDDVIHRRISSLKKRGEKPEQIKEAMGLLVDDAFSMETAHSTIPAAHVTKKEPVKKSSGIELQNRGVSISPEDLSLLQELQKKGKTKEDAERAIDLHPQITNKDGAKQLAGKLYEGFVQPFKNVLEAKSLSEKPTDPTKEKKAQEITEGMKGVANTIMRILNIPADITQEKMEKSENPIIQKLAPYAAFLVGMATPVPGDELVAGSKLVKSGAKNIEQPLTTKFLNYAEEKLAKNPNATLSRQEIMDFARRSELKKGEADLILKKLNELEDVNPLTQEARKYKSAEEFVRAQTPRVAGIAPELQGQTLYRGMSEAEWRALQAGEVSGKASKGGRTFLTTEKQTAEMAVEAGKGKGVVVELKPEAGQKVISGGKIGENTGGNLPGEYQARNIGIDDIAKVTDGNGNVIYEATTGGKTKSQLTDIWNKATKGNKIPAQDFADSIHRDLLELKPVKVKEPQYEEVHVDREYILNGSGYRPQNYEEVVFESPITTNGSSHFPNSENYFAHARGDEVVEGGKKIWREQEIQSDALQKEGLERISQKNNYGTDLQTAEARYRETHGKSIGESLTPAERMSVQERIAENVARQKEVDQLSSFTNDRFGERIMRERIREKAQKGYSKYRLPSGETIGRIEGFTETNKWWTQPVSSPLESRFRVAPDKVKIGQRIFNGDGEEWVVNQVMGEGRIKAIPRGTLVADIRQKFPQITPKDIMVYLENCL